VISGVSSSTAQKSSGARSLAVQFDGGADSQSVFIASPAAPAGATVTFKVWVPTGSAITSVQPFTLQGAAGGWGWSDSWQAITSLKTNAWNTVSVNVPQNAVTPLYQLGITFTTSGSWKGTAYIDAVNW
jgi:hypothetical protein